MVKRTLLVVWHSRTGTALALARAACHGARAALRDDTDTPQGSCRTHGEPAHGASNRVIACTTTRSDPRASSEGPPVGLDCVHATRADAQRVCAASAFLFVAPENLAALSGAMKEFFDRTYYDVLDRVQGRPYAVIVAAGSDGRGAARQIERIATGWRLRAVAEPLIVVTGAQTAAAIAARKRPPAEASARARELGATLATGLALGIY